MNKSFLFSLLLTSIMVFAASGFAGEVSATFFVATDGNDAWSGKLSEPNAQETDGPFVTLHRARDAVRELKAQSKGGLKGRVVVMVRGGKYYFDRALTLGEADSGAPQAPIIYTAYPGEKPVISGGKRITSWKPYKDNILKCEIPEARYGKFRFRQLFLDGERQLRARYPNANPKHDLWKKWYGRWNKSEHVPYADNASESYVIYRSEDGFPRNWAKPTEGEIITMREWWWGDISIIPIKSIDKDKRMIRLVHAMRDFDLKPWFWQVDPGKCSFIVENILEELDQPGEWCLDGEEGMLYFWPPQDSIEDAEVVIPVVKCLVRMNSVSNVRISGLVFTETRGGDPSSHYTDLDGIGAQRPQMGRQYCGEAIYLSKCMNCFIEHNKIHSVGGNGIYLRHHNERNMIRHNEISYAGANGVVLAGSREVRVLPARPQHPVNNQVTDNLIHHCGVLDTYNAGVFLGLSNGNLIAHNDIHDISHHGINLGNDGSGRNLIEYNVIRRTSQVSRDNGAINVWNEQPYYERKAGHIIRYNLVTDTGGHPEVSTSALYLDNGAANCFVYGNIFVNRKSVGYGICMRASRNHVIENNIIIGFSNAIAYAGPFFQPANYITGTHFRQNILYGIPGITKSVYGNVGSDELRVFAGCDYNLFFSPDRQMKVLWVHPHLQENHPAGAGFSLDEWRKYGREGGIFDIHSIMADPLFVDFANGDYRLKPESPALKLGFQPIDMTRIGPRK